MLNLNFLTFLSGNFSIGNSHIHIFTRPPPEFRNKGSFFEIYFNNNVTAILQKKLHKFEQNLQKKAEKFVYAFLINILDILELEVIIWSKNIRTPGGG